MSRRRGNDNENLVCEMAEALGYCAFPARGSRGVVDIVCFERAEWRYALQDDPRPSLVIQCGTQKKPIARTLAELQSAPRPIGSLCIVARRLAKKGRSRPWQFVTPAGKFASLKEAVEA